jgi:hypothetical protein
MAKTNKDTFSKRSFAIPDSFCVTGKLLPGRESDLIEIQTIQILPQNQQATFQSISPSSTLERSSVISFRVEDSINPTTFHDFMRIFYSLVLNFQLWANQQGEKLREYLSPEMIKNLEFTGLEF